MLIAQVLLESGIHLFAKSRFHLFLKEFLVCCSGYREKLKKMFFKGFHPVPQFGCQDGFVVVPEILQLVTHYSSLGLCNRSGRAGVSLAQRRAPRVTT